MKTTEYHEGPKAGENFEKLERAVLKAPKVAAPGNKKMTRASKNFFIHDAPQSRTKPYRAALGKRGWGISHYFCNVTLTPFRRPKLQNAAFNRMVKCTHLLGATLSVMETKTF